MKLVAAGNMQRQELRDKLLDEMRPQVKEILKKKRRNLNSETTKTNRVQANFPNQKS